MARQKLIAESPDEHTDTRAPHERFVALASKVLSVPKAEIDKRDVDWKRNRE